MPTTIDKIIAEGRYEKIENLGEGGIGSVWKVKDKQKGQIIALKIAKESDDSKQDTKIILKQEAKIIQSLQDVPNIIKIYEIDPDGQYYTMEYCKHGDLEKYLNGSLPNITKLILIIEPILNALQEAHTRVPSVLHRDIKPNNILVNEENGRLCYRLADFSPNWGGPGVMSPEQLAEFHRNDKIPKPDWRSDLYSLGSCIYKLLTGEYPYQEKLNDVATSNEETEIMYRFHILDGTPKPPKNPSSINYGLPAEIDTLLLQLLNGSRRFRVGTGSMYKISGVTDLIPILEKIASAKPTVEGISNPSNVSSGRSSWFYAPIVLIVGLVLVAGSMMIFQAGPGTGSTATATLAQGETRVVETTSASGVYPTGTPMPTSTPTSPPANTPTPIVIVVVPTDEEETKETPTTSPQPVSRPNKYPTPKCPVPDKAKITSPGEGEPITEPIDIIGIAKHDKFNKYKILWQSGSDWTCCVVNDKFQRQEGVLGQLDPSKFPKGTLTIRLDVVHNPDLNYDSCETTVIIK